MTQAHLCKAAYFTALAVVLASCSAMPAFGPDADDINRVAVDGNAVTEDALPFRVVEVSAAKLPTVSEVHATFPATFRAQGFRDKDEVVSVGDQLEIRIWEIAEDGLFATAGNRETMLEVRVSNSGNITVPYANTIAARGLTTSELRELLLERYYGQAVEPEIAVAITSTESRSATVLGNVRNPGRIEIPPRGIRLLDLIASTGGASQAPWEIRVKVQRGSVSGSLLLSDIIDSPTNNIVILPGDTVNISHEARRFAVYGGVSRPANIEIPVEDAHLAYLLAEVGGLDERVAQTRSVFVFRPSAGGSAATAYRFDFSRPDALLFASAFRLMPTDITYVASADAADFERFMSILLSPFLGTVRSVDTLGN
ncbi:polysaccharide biosynthesis/export family protein [Ruegeria profundi]|uniref:polysaccharide biosynthesis/export family protein n=1 Tax=Ruegeria profundi TaxID=1685378 RepID=UPI001CD5AD90|nr:polysaccharide biosynthesis/export family protein [Ruegeria profundi]MCA0930410.1 polysaccharide export protein [Ruegeria profundi]